MGNENLGRMLAEILEDLKPKSRHYEHLEPRFGDFPFKAPLFEKPIDPALDLLFGQKIIRITEKPTPQGFQVMPGFLHHGTSLAALDGILDSGIMYPAIDLLAQGKLVSGELKKMMDRESTMDRKGPKFMSRQAMIKMGMLTLEDPHLYQYGHAADVVFGAHPVIASSYPPKDGESGAMVCVDSKVLNFHGEKLIDAKEEGILHEGPLSIHLPLRQVIVPDTRVEEYIHRTKSSYLVTVFPFSVLK